MASFVQSHPHKGIAGLQEGVEDRHIGLRAGMGLYIRIGAAEQLFRAFPRKILDLIDALASAVIAVPRIAFRVLVGQHAAKRGHHGLAGPVLGCDQLQMGILPVDLRLNQSCNLRVGSLNVFDCVHGSPHFFMLANFVYSGSQTSFVVPIGPFLCFAMMISAMFFSSVSLL